MRFKKYRLALSFALFALAVVVVTVWYLHGRHIPVLNPEGIIGLKERNLMVFTVILGFIVIVPVFILAISIAWRYREGNTKAKYTPEWSSHRVAETIWWGIPIAIILILSVVTWISTFQLDPYKALASSKQPLTIQVVALDWKWLFIYPQQNIATVNQVNFPNGTPVDFEITSDAPMNSFWIPSLGGQIYAMPGMSTHLHLMADKSGSYAGSSANISGNGFAGMKFTARSTSTDDFNAWVKQVKQSSAVLNQAEYTTLALPSKNNPPRSYAAVQHNLYDEIVMKYMMPVEPASSAQAEGVSH